MENIAVELKIDNCYSEDELVSLNMKPIKDHQLNYFIYEKDSRVYFFDKIENDFLRLFCSTSRRSFYL